MTLSPSSMAGACESVRVTPSADERAYEIRIGPDLLAAAAAHIAPLLARPRATIITDENLAKAHLPRLTDALATADIATNSITIAAGEASKNMQQLEKLLGELLDLGVERSDMIIALGGGVVGDLAGFAAAILRRGTRLIQIPTSLLAQVDSSVGGKTAVNARQGKNLIGAFYQPHLVLADTSILASLPKRDMRAGYAEIVKYAALGDAAFFDWLESNGEKVLARAPHALTEAVRVSCTAKAEIVAGDTREQGSRALLNLGHTFGHAFETLTPYDDRLRHGEAVALGMVLAAEFSAQYDACPPEDAARLRAHLAAAGLPTTMGEIGNFRTDALLAAMAQDKKTEGGALRLILLKRLGEAFICKDIDMDALADFLRQAGAD